MDETCEVAEAELHRRKVDRNLERALPRCGLAAGLPQRPFADLGDGTVLLCERNEGVGRHEALLRMLPAAERLEAEHLAFDPGLRLVVEQQLVVAIPQREGRAAA